MKQNKLVIEINKNVEEVSKFLLDPQNTPKWIEEIIKVETNQWPTKLGSKYRIALKDPEVDGRVILKEYELVEFNENKSFELKQLNASYRVKYTLEETSFGTKLTYLERTDEGELEDPLASETMQKLKAVIEKAYFDNPNKQKAIMVELTRYKVKLGKSKRVDEWMKLIRDNAKTPENLATLDQEKMLVESIFRQKEAEEEYLYWFHIQGENPSNLTSSSYEIDKKHLKFSEECIEPDSRVDLKLEASMVPERIRKLLR